MSGAIPPDFSEQGVAASGPPAAERDAGPKTGSKAASLLRQRWRIAFLVVTTVGICLSADLVRLHVKVHTDPAYHSYCAINEWANCETVATSDYAVFLGLPVAVWGLLAYLAMAALAIWGLYRPNSPVCWPFGILLWANTFSSAVSIYLFLICQFVIESLCVVCIGTYLVNLALFAISLVEVRRLGFNPFNALKAEVRSFAERRLVLTVFCSTGVAAVLVLWVAVPEYWQLSEHKGPGGLAVGTTAEGHPWIGAREPDLIIGEFSDYQCPFCEKGHDRMRKLVQDTPDRVRLVHWNYPLDHSCNRQLDRPFHPHACRYAAMAVCALKQGRFWEANDYLFSRGRRKKAVTAAELASAIKIKADRLAECVKSEETAHHIQQDLEAGRSLNLRGTPTYVIGDRSYEGAIPPDVLSAALGE
jgi:protein-disulfide isomerase/uncharacterized membrane protein